MKNQLQNLWKIQLCVVILSFFFTTRFLLSSNISEVKTYGNFETAGIIIKVDDMNFNEIATIEYKKTGSFDYKFGHDFTRYDGNHLATSLFKLDFNTVYDLRITLIDPDGVTGTNPYLTSVSTKAEFSIPTALRIVNVKDQNELDAAISDLKPGDEVRLSGGIYASGIHVFNISGTKENPIVFTSHGSTNTTIMGNSDNAIGIERGSNYIFNNLEVHNEQGTGVFFRACHNMTITNCYIHDSRDGDYTANIEIQHGEEANPPLTGNFLIMNNVISDELHDTVDENQGPLATNINEPGQSYFGIDCRYNPGPNITIRNNLIYGVVDGIHPCADEGDPPVLGPDDLDVLNSWVDRELDIYDNVIYDCKDDDIELDGHMVNGRVFRNRLGKCENTISVAPVYPGPIFILRNYLSGFHQGCLKQNTGVPGITRGVLFYHNTIWEKPRAKPPHCESENCLYRGEEALQQSFVYKNNIFYARGRVYNGDMYTGGYHKDDIFDYNLNYSTKESESANPYIYKWVTYEPDTLNNSRYETMDAFRAATGQELHGTWGEPLLNTTLYANYPQSAYLFKFTTGEGSVGIDKGVYIRGINDDFLGNAPDIGAFESEITGVDEEVKSQDSPIKAVQLCPNPFSDAVLINVLFNTKTESKIEIVDVLGYKIKTLFEGIPTADYLKLIWVIETERISSGIYLLRIVSGDEVKTEKLVLSR
ncbi:MAG: right-handed parallel beta-helix repeat-containing protein [Ignavibacteriae bacterium]|nr:right-handed parallel beta-helix repeat-containing protein [Ignavibacteriota bacterium]